MPNNPVAYAYWQSVSGMVVHSRFLGKFYCSSCILLYLASIFRKSQAPDGLTTRWYRLTAVVLTHNNSKQLSAYVRLRHRRYHCTLGDRAGWISLRYEIPHHVLVRVKIKCCCVQGTRSRRKQRKRRKRSRSASNHIRTRIPGIMLYHTHSPELVSGSCSVCGEDRRTLRSVCVWR